MSRIRLALIAASLSVVPMSTAGSSQDSGVSRPACTFSSSEAAKPTIVGPDRIVERVDVVQPLDAPIRILRVDLTGATLTMDGFFRFTHNWSVDVINVTDQVTRAIGPMVWVYSGNAAGAHKGGGFEPFHRVPLGPGERRVLRGTGTVTEDLIASGDDVRLRVGIALVRYDACTWDNYRNLSPRFASADSEQGEARAAHR